MQSVKVWESGFGAEIGVKGCQRLYHFGDLGLEDRDLAKVDMDFEGEIVLI